MDKYSFSEIISLPKQWVDAEMYPDEIFHGQFSEFVKDGEQLDCQGLVEGAEHYRNGVYWYWIKNQRNCDIDKLREMLALEPDVKMRRWVLSQL